MVTGESRGDTGLERSLFCGAGAAGARDLTNYPAFMRAGLRSSLRANYAVPNLGFRCAQSITASAGAPLITPSAGTPLDGTLPAASGAPAPTSKSP